MQFEDGSRPLTYAAAAATAQVSRAWLYTQPDIRSAIDWLRRVNGRSTAPLVPPPAAHRDVAELREQVAVAHADLREARRPAGRGTEPAGDPASGELLGAQAQSIADDGDAG